MWQFFLGWQILWPISDSWTGQPFQNLVFDLHDFSSVEVFSQTVYLAHPEVNQVKTDPWNDLNYGSLLVEFGDLPNIVLISSHFDFYVLLDLVVIDGNISLVEEMRVYLELYLFQSRKVDLLFEVLKWLS